MLGRGRWVARETSHSDSWPAGHPVRISPDHADRLRFGLALAPHARRSAYVGAGCSPFRLAPSAEVRSMPSSRCAALRLATIMPLIAAVALSPSFASAQKQARTRNAPKNQSVVAAVRGSAPDSTFLSALEWRFIGPEGNRTDAIAGVPGDPNTYYA